MGSYVERYGDLSRRPEQVMIREKTASTRQSQPADMPLLKIQVAGTLGDGLYARHRFRSAASAFIHTRALTKSRLSASIDLSQSVGPCNQLAQQNKNPHTACRRTASGALNHTNFPLYSPGTNRRANSQEQLPPKINTNYLFAVHRSMLPHLLAA